MKQPLVQARHLCYAYPKGPEVVRDVSLSAAAGTMTAIIGSNGSGKSTLVRMLAGLLKPRTGEIVLGDVPFDRWPPYLRAREVAYVPQSTSAAFPFEVIDLVLSGRTPYISRLRFESSLDRERARHALELAGAAHLAGRSFTSLSGGERQMVSLARALAQEAKLLLLDEPSSSLDLKHRAGMIRTLASLREKTGLTVVMITHDLQLTGVFDKVVALRCGKVAANGKPGEVLCDHKLCEIYDDPNVRSRCMGKQHVVWVDL